MLFRIFAIVSEPRKFQGPPDRILGQPTWWGGGVGGGEKQILFGEEI